MSVAEDDVERGEHETDPGYRWRWPALVVIMIGSAMEMLDVSVTVLAGPTIRSSLQGGTSDLQWYSATYTLALACGLITGGRLGDIVGRRRMFLIGMAGFTLGSALCAAAVTSEMLIIVRAVQGLFGAAMIPQGLGIIKEMFPPSSLSLAFNAMGPFMAVFSLGGPVFGGWLLEADLLGAGWRMIFLVNVPIGVVGGLAALLTLPPDPPSQAVKLDWPGVALASVGSLLMVFPIVQGREYDWPIWTYAMMGGSLAAFIVFGRHEARRSRRGADTLVVPGLFRKRSYVAGMTVGLMYFAALSGFGLAFTLYLQLGLGYSPAKTSVTGTAMTAGIIVGSLVMPKLSKYGRRVFHGGAAITVAGLVSLSWVMWMDVTPWRLVPSLLVAGLGSSLMMGPFFALSLADVEPHEMGTATGALSALQQGGSSVGAALLGTVFFETANHGFSVPVAAFAAFAVAGGMAALMFLAGFLFPAYRPQPDLRS
ncbi:MFS transporter [Nonomuraea deserti]|uniref:MFS transporter n=1 Tax=Nonomuraea deserti TaxID=1848322 RepID=A0A4R4V9R6_9ACTN|nr:MFS transporter [Nonomuraea deserti]TDD02059.1 MFS transporter [Nonomuraea deserti]